MFGWVFLILVDLEMMIDIVRQFLNWVTGFGDGLSEISSNQLLYGKTQEGVPTAKGVINKFIL